MTKINQSTNPPPHRRVAPNQTNCLSRLSEKAPVSAMPAPNYLHVWWARRPLSVSRAAVAASLLQASSESERFCNLSGTYPGIVQEQLELDAAKEMGVKLKEGYSQKRAFTHNLTSSDADWLNNNLAVSDSLVMVRRIIPTPSNAPECGRRLTLRLNRSMVCEELPLIL